MGNLECSTSVRCKMPDSRIVLQMVVRCFSDGGGPACHWLQNHLIGARRPLPPRPARVRRKAENTLRGLCHKKIRLYRRIICPDCTDGLFRSIILIFFYSVLEVSSASGAEASLSSVDSAAAAPFALLLPTRIRMTDIPAITSPRTIETGVLVPGM